MRVQALVHVTPDDGAQARIAVGNRKELVGILQADRIDPATAHAHRVMMQCDEHVALAGVRQARIEARELRGAHVPESLSGHAAVDHHDPPGAQVMETTDLEGRGSQLAAHEFAIVVIAGQAPYRLAQVAKQLAHRGVAARVVVDQITREQQGVGIPVVRPGVLQHALERVTRVHAAQGTVSPRHEVRVGELQQPNLIVHGAHVTGCAISTR